MIDHHRSFVVNSEDQQVMSVGQLDSFIAENSSEQNTQRDIMLQDITFLFQIQSTTVTGLTICSASVQTSFYRLKISF